MTVMKDLQKQRRPRLSVIVVIGICRKRGQRCVDALYTQTVGDVMEVIIVDLAAHQYPKIKTKRTIRTKVVVSSPDTTWAKVRKSGIDYSQGDIIAFIEDHTIPASTWAEELIIAHQGPWAAIGYAFTNANPRTYISRASLVADYAFWMDPLHSGPAKLLPGNNVSYKRVILLSLGDRLDDDLGVDFNIHEALKLKGHKLYLEGRAIVAHENYERLHELLQANYHYCRLLAANRATSCSWSLMKRLVYGLSVPFGAPVIKLIRLFSSLRRRRALWKSVVISSPVLIITYLWSAIGESLGYLQGTGTSNESFMKWELNKERGRDDI